jgi:hypothetical protein
VLLLLTMYVVAAVPVNWLVFRTLKRTEWAWLATPVLAMVFTVVVVRAANLDLGFVRSVSETAVLEIQPGYDRGNLVRCTAIYNSLGTTYQLSSDDPNFAALPAARTLDGKQPPMDETLTLDRRGDDSASARSGLAGFVVDSGSVGYVRAEQMTPLGGVLRGTRLPDRRIRLENGTSWHFYDVRLVGAGGRGALDGLAPGAVVEVTLERGSSPPAGDAADPGDIGGRRAVIDVDPLWEQLQALPEEEGLRLVAWSPATAPGMQIEPAPSQQRGKTVVVAHLEYDSGPSPMMDSNTRSDVEQRVGRNP